MKVSNILRSYSTVLLVLLSLISFSQSTNYIPTGAISFGTVNPTVTGQETDNDSFIVTSDGTPTGTPISFWKFDEDTLTWVQVPSGGTTCLEPMARAALIALRDSGELSKDCHYVITNPSANGTLTAQAIILHSVDDNTLSMQAGIKTSYDNTAWQGIYDIDIDDVLEVTDNLQNNIQENASVISFPYGNALVTNNKVLDGNITYVSGTFTQNVVNSNANVTVNSGIVARNHFEAASNTTVTSSDFVENKVEGDATVVTITTGDVDNNIFKANSNTTINTGNFDQNEVHSDANVLINGGVAILNNHFYSESNTTINSGDFRNNQVQNDATVTSSTTGDIDLNVFGNLSNSNFSGDCNFDNSIVNTDANVTMTGGSVVNCKFEQLSNYVMSGGVLRESTVGQDADVTIISGDNYENVFGTSTIYTQVGTGYIRYSTIEGTASWINGNTNVSNVQSYVSTVNTTGSSGTISNSTFNRAYMQNLQNIPTLTIADSTISEYGTVQTNGSSRIYIYRCNITGGARVLCAAGARIDMSYTNVSSFGYIQTTVSGGVLYANYCDVSSNSYIRNATANVNTADRCNVSSQSSIRFDGSANNCRVYYSSVSGGGAIYHTGTSNNSYIYYCTANSVGQIYTQNSVNARIYYSDADSYSYVRSLNNTTTHYIYYAKATGRGYVQLSGNTAQVRIYSVTAQGQSIVELRNCATASNLYYSTFSAYYYAYITRTGGTSSGLFGQGRRTNTVTNPVLQGIGNLNNQTYLDNF